MKSLKSLFAGLFTKEETVSKKEEKGIKIPELYKQYFSIVQYHNFILLIEEYWAERNRKIKVDAEHEKLLIFSSDGLYLEKSLTELIHSLSKLDQERWKETVESYFEEAESEEPVKNVFADYNFIKDYLAVRIYQEDFVDKFQLEDFVYRIDLEKTITMLVLDLPYSVESVLTQHANQWEKSKEELFDVAIKNLQEHYRPDLEKTNQNVIAFKGDNFFLTSNILYLQDYPEVLGEYGCLVAIPNRDVLICKPINNDIDVEVGLQVMIPFVDEIYESEEGQIARNVYWYYNGKFEMIFSTIGLSRFNYVLPTDLENMLY